MKVYGVFRFTFDSQEILIKLYANKKDAEDFIKDIKRYLKIGVKDLEVE